MNMLSKYSLSALLAGVTVLGSVAFAGTALAAGPMFGPAGSTMPRPAVVGTVASISGDSLTVTAKSWQRSGTAPTTTTAPTSTTYTVDATNATVTKSGAASSVSAIATGDMVMVMGTVNGTSVTATSIRDGMMMGRGMGAGMHKPMPNASTTPLITGNGEPVIGGSITAISGTTLTVTTKSGTAYTVDATSATITKGNAVSTLSSVATGDNVVVQGTVNGTSVTASSVLDQGAAPAAGAKPAPHGILGAIGGFFTHLFGFF